MDSTSCKGHHHCDKQTGTIHGFQTFGSTTFDLSKVTGTNSIFTSHVWSWETDIFMQTVSHSRSSWPSIRSVTAHVPDWSLPVAIRRTSFSDEMLYNLPQSLSSVVSKRTRKKWYIIRMFADKIGEWISCWQFILQQERSFMKIYSMSADWVVLIVLFKVITGTNRKTSVCMVHWTTDRKLPISSFTCDNTWKKSSYIRSMAM